MSLSAGSPVSPYAKLTRSKLTSPRARPRGLGFSGERISSGASSTSNTRCAPIRLCCTVFAIPAMFATCVENCCSSPANTNICPSEIPTTAASSAVAARLCWITSHPPYASRMIRLICGTKLISVPNVETRVKIHHFWSRTAAFASRNFSVSCG